MQARGWTLMSLVGPFQARIFCDSMIYHRVVSLVLFLQSLLVLFVVTMHGLTVNPKLSCEIHPTNVGKLRF